MESHVPCQPLHVDHIQQVDLNVDWSQFQSAQEWAKQQPMTEWKQFYADNGYLEVKSILNEREVAIYRDVCERMMSGDIDTGRHRHDLGNHTARQVEGTDNICQIMWPCLYVRDVRRGPLHARTRLLATHLIGEHLDVDMDFDMIIAKPPHTCTVTPWHQDAAYWPPLPPTPDGSPPVLQSCSIWVSLDRATPDNGCMWFVSGSHLKPLREHWRVQGKHVQECQASESEGVCVPLSPGGCTVHDGYTLHYTRGNTTGTPRRAYIVAYRPRATIQYLRGMGFDHGKQGLLSLFDKDERLDVLHN